MYNWISMLDKCDELCTRRPGEPYNEDANNRKPGEPYIDCLIRNNPIEASYYENTKVCNFNETYVTSFFEKLVKNSSNSSIAFEFAKNTGTFYHSEENFLPPKEVILCRSEYTKELCPPLESSHIFARDIGDGDIFFCIYTS